MQVVHDHSTSSGISGSSPVPRYSPSRRSRISCRGASGVPAAVAGHTAVQRPHSVHVNASSTCFQFRSAAAATPAPPSRGRSSAAVAEAGTRVIDSGRSASRGGSLAKNRLGIAVMTWKCLVSGSRHRNTSTVTLCSHQPASDDAWS
jgi:hypothetical protein